MMPSSDSEITCHILITVFQSWGHYKTAIGFACKLLQECPSGLLITFLSAGKHTDLAEIEAENNFIHRDTSSKRNLRFVHLGGQGTSFMDLSVCLLQNFPSLCEILFSPGKSIESLDGLVYINPRKPDVFICDIFSLDLCKTFRESPGCTASVLTWISSGIGASLQVMGPEALGGPGDVPAKAKLLAAESGGKPSEIEMELYRPTKGDVHHLFGGINRYDYEQFPQGHNIDPIFPLLVHVYNQAHRMFMDTDGLLIASNTVFEPEAIEACKKWCDERGKSCYAVGPFTVEVDQLETMQLLSIKSSDMAARTINFMDQVYASHGAQSLLFFSFGTIYSPNAQSLFAFLRVILDLNIPLLFLHEPTRHGELPLELKADLDASNIVHVCAWASQELVLSHKATGWFLTHCGLGGIAETIYHGVPMIAWPIHSDQPYQAAYCALKLGIAYELLEVRIIEGLRPLYRGVTPTGTTEAIIEEARTVLKNAFGEDGKTKRINVEKLREKMRLLSKEGGDSLEDARRFISKYVPTMA